MKRDLKALRREQDKLISQLNREARRDQAQPPLIRYNAFRGWEYRLRLGSDISVYDHGFATALEAEQAADAKRREMEGYQVLLYPVGFLEEQAAAMKRKRPATLDRILAGQPAKGQPIPEPNPVPAAPSADPEPEGFACSAAEMDPLIKQPPPPEPELRAVVRPRVSRRPCDRCGRLARVRRLGTLRERFCPCCYDEELSIRRMEKQAREELRHRV
jgi:hypothetical protein